MNSSKKVKAKGARRSTLMMFLDKSDIAVGRAELELQEADHLLKKVKSWVEVQVVLANKKLLSAGQLSEAVRMEEKIKELLVCTTSILRRRTRYLDQQINILKTINKGHKTKKRAKKTDGLSKANPLVKKFCELVNENSFLSKKEIREMKTIKNEMEAMYQRNLN